MASSGTIKNDFRTGYRLQIKWEIDSQNIEDNTSTVIVKVQLVSTGSEYTIISSVEKNGTLTVNGKNYNFTFTASLNANQTKTIYTKTLIIPHDTDGDKVCDFSATIGLNVTLTGVYWGNITAKGSGTFNNIPRASQPTLDVSTQEMGGDIVITVDRASTDFLHTFRYKFGNATGVIAENIQRYKTWNIPLSLASEIPKLTSGKGLIYCDTYKGDELIGTKSVEFTATVPASVVPVINSVSISEAITEIATKFKTYVQNKSKLNCKINAVGAYGSTISSVKTTINNVEYSGSEFLSEILNKSGNIDITTVITDSRGRKATKTNTINVLAYSAPDIISFSAIRCNDNGDEDDESSKLKIDLNYKITAINNLNDNLYEIKYRLKDSTEWINLLKGNYYVLEQEIISGEVFSPDEAYDLMLSITDFFQTTSYIIDIPSAFNIIDINQSGKGIAFGKVSEKDCMEINMNVEISGTIIDEEKVYPTLLNGWVKYSENYESAFYYKDKSGVVHIGGMIKSGAVEDGTDLFELPEAYRPNKVEKFACVSYNSICSINIQRTGMVSLQVGGNKTWLSLGGIQFKAK